MTRSDAQYFANAARVTEALFGNATTANLFVVGMAVQAGCLPVSPACLEEAIRLNGVAIESNLAAFRWGRTQVADPASVEARRAGSGRVGGHHHPLQVLIGGELLGNLAVDRVAATDTDAPIEASAQLVNSPPVEAEEDDDRIIDEGNEPGEVNARLTTGLGGSFGTAAATRCRSR